MTGTAVKCEVQRHLTGKETEPWEILYFKVYRSQLQVVEKALETARLMLGTDKSQGYCLEMICADFLVGAILEKGASQFPSVATIDGTSEAESQLRRPIESPLLSGKETGNCSNSAHLNASKRHMSAELKLSLMVYEEDKTGRGQGIPGGDFVAIKKKKAFGEIV